GAGPGRGPRRRRWPAQQRGEPRPGARARQRAHGGPHRVPGRGAAPRDAIARGGPRPARRGGAPAGDRGGGRDRPQHGLPGGEGRRQGAGRGLMRDPLRAAVIFRTLRKAVAGAFTIKIRGGWDDRTVNAPEIARLAESEGVDGVTVHPRTRSQQYTGRAPWDVIADVVDAVRIPVVGNGDVSSVDDARAMVAATGCASVMIGRGALGRPWIIRGVDVPRDARATI